MCVCVVGGGGGGGWPYKDLRREALFPLGVQLILETLKMTEDGRYSVTSQDESLAAWEPPIEQIYNALYAITLHVVQFLRVFFPQENSRFSSTSSFICSKAVANSACCRKRSLLKHCLLIIFASRISQLIEN